MKKLLILGITCLAMSSCVKTYDCECTHIADDNGSSAGEPDIVETTEVKGRTSEFASIECDGLTTKYWGQDYSGTCSIK